MVAPMVFFGRKGWLWMSGRCNLVAARPSRAPGPGEKRRSGGWILQPEKGRKVVAIFRLFDALFSLTFRCQIATVWSSLAGQQRRRTAVGNGLFTLLRRGNPKRLAPLIEDRPSVCATKQVCGCRKPALFAFGSKCVQTHAHSRGRLWSTTFVEMQQSVPARAGQFDTGFITDAMNSSQPRAAVVHDFR